MESLNQQLSCMGIMDTALLVFDTWWSFPPCFSFFFAVISMKVLGKCWVLPEVY